MMETSLDYYIFFNNKTFSAVLASSVCPTIFSKSLNNATRTSFTSVQKKSQEYPSKNTTSKDNKGHKFYYE